MNKTTTANIGGVVFHIDVDAYDKLQSYLNAIARYFDKSEGKDEIMADIESRIAEILKERKGMSSQVVGMEDVNEVIRTMGEPEQYADPDAEGAYEEPKEKSTYGHHQRYYDNKKRRLFRDPDNRHLGGVCSGIANYFGFDPVWLRLLFVLMVIGFGTGILLYIILWVVIPEAKTTAEKLEMRGEPINVDNIGKTIDEEINRMKDQFNEFTERTKKNINSKETVNKAGNAIEKFFHFLSNIITDIARFAGKVFSVVFRVLGKIFGLIFFLFGFFLLLILFSMLFNATSVLSITSEGFHYYSLHDLFSYVSTNPSHWIFAIIGCILFLGIPVIMLVYGGIRLLFNINSGRATRSIGIIGLSLWLIGLVITFILVFQLSMEFRNESRVEDEIPLQQPTGKQIRIEINKDLFVEELDETFEDKFLFRYRSNDGEVELFRVGDLMFEENGHGKFVGIPQLNIKKSNSGEFQLKMKKFAHGVTSRQAESRARAIEYHIEQYDSVLVFDPVYDIRDEMVFRNQHLRLDLLIPENTIISIGENMGRLLYNSGNISDEWLEKSEWDWHMSGHKWIMRKDGLVCLTCEGTSLEMLDSLELKTANSIEL